ncbi:hypothetical protein FPZ24_02030 [Sphingomonas panacisoli]|uniref:Uncharacterized protein n=1 Tax=Sphingomonas panacisoli TaxID=1813879 RepID=A0A5B8LFH0_9SPHN|nr:hypothetical protein [Sphingomonas panacisoli]QDZ06402.1 hypothetical protein FPZ24_02030 [Sphingomonas panacisoli]
MALMVLLATGAVAACTEPDTSVANLIDASDNNTLETPEPVATPTAYYSEHEGDRYLYVTAVSEEQKKQGRAVGDVLQYRFLGEKDGVLTLERVAENGTVIGQLQCRRDCHIMTFTFDGGSVQRIPFDGDSVSGSAMTDAINGLLVPVKAPPPPVTMKRVPAQFVGNWQSRVTECGQGTDDSVVSVTATKLTFYESILDVASVQMLSATRVMVTGVLTDEGDRTQAMSYTLSVSGGRLTVDDDGVERARCPS